MYYRVTKNNMDNSGQEYLLLNPCLSIIVIIDYKWLVDDSLRIMFLQIYEIWLKFSPKFFTEVKT